MSKRQNGQEGYLSFFQLAQFIVYKPPVKMYIQWREGVGKLSFETGKGIDHFAAVGRGH